MALIRTINRLGAAGYGVNILEETPPAQVRGAGSSKVAVVGDFPWGPVDTPTVVSGASLFETFCPLEFQAEDDYDSMKAFISKTFPDTILVVRLDPSSVAAAAASYTFPHTTSTDSVVVTARYQGALGNQIRISFADNADTAANSDMTVKVLGSDGTTVTYQATYLNAIVDGGSTLSVSAEAAADPFVITTIAAGAPDTAPDEVTDQALTDTAGADGTAVIGDWTDALDTLADSSLDWDVVFGAEVPSALVEAWNDGLKTFMDTNARGFGIMSTPTAQSVASAITEVDTAQRSDRLMRPWRKVKILNTFDPDRATITVDGNSFAAVATANTDPWVSPGGAQSVSALKAIVGVEDGIIATDAQLESLTEAGLTPIVMAPALGGAILRNARTTSITSDDTRRVFRRRMVDYLSESISNVLVQYAERPLDVDITNSRLGNITGPEIGIIRAFMEDLKSRERVRDYSLDAFSPNLQSNINAGQWIILLRTWLVSMQEEIVLRLQAGTNVIIEEG